MTNRPVYFGDPAELIRFARKAGLSTGEIVRKLTQGETLDNVKRIAREYATLVGVTESDFVKIARGRKSAK